MKLPHESYQRVYYEDTDSSGFVYHTSYLKFSERARSEMLSEFFPDVVKSLKMNTFFFVVKSLEINFVKPSQLFDKLRVLTYYVDNSIASLKLKHVIFLKEQIICQILVKLVWINGNKKKPVRMPKNIISRFKSFEIV